MTDTPAAAHRHPLREPMVWMVIGLPAAVVVAGLFTLSLAIRSGGADVVIDPVSRVGKGQTIDLEPDRAAARLGLSAELQLAGDTEAVELRTLGGSFDAPLLRLVLSHPSEARGDLSLDLVKIADDRYGGRLALPRDHAWNLHLAPADAAWRLQGRLERDALSAPLSPAVDEG